MAERTLYQWFAESAARHPDAPALDIADHVLTYRELHRCALAVAGHLAGEHGGPPRRVGLLAARSVVALAGYLAATRLGATVVPLNPGYPLPRNRTVCDLAGVDVLLADESGAPQLRAGLGAHVPTVVACTDAQVLDRAGGPVPDVPCGLGDPAGVAYILFTSGSTGRPKGVPIRHRNLSPYLAHSIARFGVAPGCRMSHTFDLTFDPSVFDLFVTWGGGATLVVPRHGDLLTPVDYVVGRGLTHWFCVPSVVSVSQELGNLPTGLATALRHSVFIGEQLTHQQARAWHAVAPASTIDNVYGPTELTVACTAYRLPPDPRHWPDTANGTVPIGPVHAFLDHVVLDGGGDPAADGELCVRGPQRFDGYLDGSDDRDRFVALTGHGAVPYRGEGRIVAGHYYRTGDRVRYEAGTLVHCGRLDTQVKVRGYRVELGEIEAVLRTHPDVGQAVVLAVGAGSDTELVGCYTGTPLPPDDLVRWLRRQVPLHMVPRRLHHLRSVPLNANGKVDRARLAELVLARHHTRT